MDRKHIGTAHVGLTNRELAAGRGTFVNDIQMPGMTYLVVLRSVFAHARIVYVDTRAALAVEGVLAVLTGQDAKQVFNPIPEGWNTAEVGAKRVDWYPLVSDRVRYVGEAVAAVVAESKHVAQLASRLIEVEYEQLDAVTDPEAAMQAGSSLVEPAWATTCSLPGTGPPATPTRLSAALTGWSPAGSSRSGSPASLSSPGAW